VPDGCDNCPLVDNPDQRDSDGQDGGDLCDPCPGDATDQCLANQTAAGTIDSSGGALTTPDGTVSIEVPPSTLSDPTSVSITGGLVSSNYGLGTNSTVLHVEMQPEGLIFNPPVTVTFAWADADNNGRVDGTGIAEANLKIFRNGVLLFGSAKSCRDFTDANCTVASCCDMTANTWSFQRDQFSEYAFARECTVVVKPRLTITRRQMPPGDDRLVFKGAFTLPSGMPFTDVDPLLHGIQFVLDDEAGTILDIPLPAGPFDGDAGWTVNNTRTKRTYNDMRAAPPGGIVKAVIQDLSTATPGLVKFLVKGKAGSYGMVTTAVIPGLVLPDVAECVAARFVDPAPAPTCTLNVSGRTLRCK
jgi:hypothetical protein